MKMPTMLTSIVFDSIEMYKKDKYKLINNVIGFLSNESVDNANEWLKQVDETKLFVALAIGEYLVNHKEEQGDLLKDSKLTDVYVSQTERVKTLEDEIAFWKEKYDQSLDVVNDLQKKCDSMQIKLVKNQYLNGEK